MQFPQVMKKKIEKIAGKKVVQIQNVASPDDLTDNNIILKIKCVAEKLKVAV